MPQRQLLARLHELVQFQLDEGEHQPVELVCQRLGEIALIYLDVYHATLVRGTPTLNEHLAMGWFTAEELPTLDWAEADIPALQKVILHLGG